MEEIIRGALNNTAAKPAASVDGEQIKISVVGVGGGGNNTINRLKRLGVRGAQLVALNADKQHLSTA